jgi:hypothetical protein
MTKAEEVARAMYDWLARNGPSYVGADDDLSAVCLDGDVDLISLARMAIAAMREPTEAMKTRSEDIHWDYSCHVCGGVRDGWYAMIDAALAETP